jgi:RNA recognition motif-containing protein
MSQKLFIGGLSWNTTDADLAGAFERFGEVLEATVVTDRETGRSRGFGFVSLGDSADVNAAIKEMDGSELDGRQIRVNEARERTGGGGGGGRRPGGGGGDRGPRGGGGGDRGRGGQQRRDRW